MRRWLLGGLAALGLLLPGRQAVAEPACAPGETLGVSRVIEIDTETGPRFGGKKKEFEILEDGEVILTFDDGPIRGYTKAVLSALDAQCTKATFFVVGRMALADPEMVREYARRGHTVGTHSWSHANLQKITPLKARQEIELGISAVQLAMGGPIAPFFRFPYLAETRSSVLHVQGRHLAAFNIDVDSKDYRAHDGAAVHRKVMADLAVAHKGIILFHDIQASTARGLPALLADLKAHGYRVVHMIPKDKATTDPRFDDMARSYMGRRHVASAASPLADRAVTWPAQATDKPERASSRQKAQREQPEPKPDPFGWITKILP